MLANKVAIAALALSVTGAMNSGTARAQANTSGKTIRIVVGFGDGGATDIVARVLSSKLTESLGQQVYVENRSGAGGTIATEAVAELRFRS